MFFLKKVLIHIALFIILAILIFVGLRSNKIALVYISTIASAAIGSVISIIFDSIDTSGQGIRLWFQHIKYYNSNIRLSFSYLFRIQVNDKYLLVKGNRLKNQFQPVGGVYKYYEEAKPFLEGLEFFPDTKMKNHKETDDIRINIKGKYLIKFVNWFLEMKDREYDPYREFKEELLDTGYLPIEEFGTIKYRKTNVHNNGVEHSIHLDCNEFVYADIFELKLTNKQLDLLEDAVKQHKDVLCLATIEELRTECYDGIEKNIGNNAKWLIGE